MKPTSDHSFQDAEILDWKLSPQLLEVEVSNVFFRGEARGRARLSFPLITPVKAMSFDGTRWVEESEVEPLKDIREFYFKKERHYSLKGVGAKSGMLVGLGVLSSEAQIAP